MAKKLSWSKNVLIHQIENQTYEKTLLNQTNFAQTLPEEIRRQAQLAIKDEYTFDFLELADEYSERQLQQALLAKIEHLWAACLPSSAATFAWKSASRNIPSTFCFTIAV